LGKVQHTIEQWALTRPPDDPLVERRRRELAEVTAKFRMEPPPEVVEIARSPWPTQQVLELVAQKTWRLLVAPERESFITSDCPAMFFEGLGLGNPESELTLPLSPRFALIADHKGERFASIIVAVKPKIVREVNRRVIAHCERFVFADAPQPWVARVAHKPKPYLSRIHWNSWNFWRFQSRGQSPKLQIMLVASPRNQRYLQ
jgi:hypothetical protein